MGVESFVRFRNPGTFYITDHAHEYDWTVPQENLRWQDGEKTLFDPCPAGWRIPKCGTGSANVWGAFQVSDGTWYGIDDTAPERGQGYLFSTSVVFGGTVWLPTAGYRSAPKGSLEVPSLAGFIPSSTSDVKDTQHMSNAFWYDRTHMDMVLHHRAHGFPVRCIRE